MLYWYLVLNIWYQSSRSWGFAATSETPWNFRYNFFLQCFRRNGLEDIYKMDQGTLGSKFIS
jgi:hypothetical protein